MSNRTRLTATTRRSFLRTTTQGLALAGLAGCAGITVFTTQAVSGKITVDRSAFPELSIPGKGIIVKTMDAGEPIILIALEAGQFRALSGVCTHLACSVRLSGRGLTCPCHGSTYSLDGQVTRGPAPGALYIYHTTVSDDSVIITLN